MARFDFMNLLLVPHGSGDYGLDSFFINTESLKVYWCFQPKEPATITHLGFCPDVVRGTPPVYRISLRDLDVDGNPSAYLVSRFFTPDASMVNHFTWVKLPTTYKARRGEWLCVSVEYYSGYISSNNCMRLRVILGDPDMNGWWPFMYGPETYAGSVSGRGNRTSCHGIFGYKSTSRSYGFPIKAVLNTQFNSPAQKGLRIFLGSGFGKSYKILGSIFEGKTYSIAGQSFDMILYDALNTELNRIHWEGNIGARPTWNGSPTKLVFDDATLATLSFGKEYFLAFAPTQSDSGFALATFEVEENFDMTAFPGSSNFYLVERASPGDVWTRVRTQRPVIDLVLDDWST